MDYEINDEAKKEERQKEKREIKKFGRFLGGLLIGIGICIVLKYCFRFDIYDFIIGFFK